MAEYNKLQMASLGVILWWVMWAFTSWVIWQTLGGSVQFPTHRDAIMAGFMWPVAWLALVVMFAGYLVGRVL